MGEDMDQFGEVVHVSLFYVACHVFELIVVC